MEEDEYAIVSKREFLALKKELDKLKQNPLEGSDQGETLQSSIDNLNKSLNTMLEVFKQAADEMKLEEHDTELVAKQMGPITDKLDTLIDQNQKIAKGIVAVADMVKEKLDEISEKVDKPALPSLRPLPPMPKPVASGPSPPSGGSFPPPGGMPPPGGPGGMPPPGAPAGPPPMPAIPPLGGDSSGDDFPPPGGMPPPGAPPAGSPSPSGSTLLGGLMR